MGPRGAGGCEILSGGAGMVRSIESWELLGDPVVHPEGKRVVAGRGGGISSGLLGRDITPPGRLRDQGRVWPAPHLASPARWDHLWMLRSASWR